MTVNIALNVSQKKTEGLGGHKGLGGHDGGDDYHGAPDPPQIKYYSSKDNFVLKIAAIVNKE